MTPFKRLAHPALAFSFTTYEALVPTAPSDGPHLIFIPLSKGNFYTAVLGTFN